MLTTRFTLVPAKQPFGQKIPDQIISTREKFCLAAVGAQLWMRCLTTSVRSKCAEGNAIPGVCNSPKAAEKAQEAGYN